MKEHFKDLWIAVKIIVLVSFVSVLFYVFAVYIGDFFIAIYHNNQNDATKTIIDIVHLCASIVTILGVSAVLYWLKPSLKLLLENSIKKLGSSNSIVFSMVAIKLGELTVFKPLDIKKDEEEEHDNKK